MELYLIEDYNEIYPQLKGADLTNALVKDLLQDNGWIERDQIQIRRLPGGKPVLADLKDAQDGAETPGRPVHFSVSHTGHLFGCIIAEVPVGLDIQKVTGAKARRLADRYFTDAEIAWIEADADLAEESFRDRFFRLWCRKEAYAKLTGEGLTAVLSGASVLDRTELEFQDLNLGNDIYGCICTYN
ncbi:MAG: 4'-phosphopantetheinyl transferase superfamily protein [Firmicutes bacterium]|nr:4'-phosphopantetheinyl transferase superfamily protein [Bacillota bacterium]MBQ9060282.1 4'-phosphopantetheinyl transferase superfamily protein [Bacillota bacterium]